jgi:hypothetical protein
MYNENKWRKGMGSEPLHEILLIVLFCPILILLIILAGILRAIEALIGIKATVFDKRKAFKTIYEQTQTLPKRETETKGGN